MVFSSIVFNILLCIKLLLLPMVVVNRVDPLGWELMAVGQTVGTERRNYCPVRKLVVRVERKGWEMFTKLSKVIDRDWDSHSYRDNHPHGVRSSE